MTIKEIIQKLYTAITDACLQESNFESWLILNDGIIDAIDALKALDKQEPVAWITPDGEGFRIRFSPPVNDVPLGWVPLYTTPPQRKPLTDEQIDNAMAENKQTLIDAADNYWKMRRAYARIIEAAHGIKE